MNQEWFRNRLRIDSMRGFACLLLVYFHTVIDFSHYNSQKLELLININVLLSDVRMPLFSFISGLIFAYKPHQSKDRAFIEKKAQRLLIPFLLMTFLILGMKTIYQNTFVPASLAELPYYLVYGYSHLWFLQSIFIIFCFYSAFHAAFRVLPVYYCAIFICSVAAYFSVLTTIEIFSIGGAVYLMPFFTLGMLVTTYLDWLASHRNLLLVSNGICFSIALILSVYANIAADQHSEANSLIVGLSFLLLIYLAFPKIPVLRRVGAYSFTIFLFHSIFIALGIRLFPEIPVIGIPLTVALAILGPITVEIFIDHFIPRLRFSLGKGFN